MTSEEVRAAISAGGGFVAGAELGELLGVNRSRGYQLVEHPTFPQPIGWTLKRRPMWLAAEVLEWDDDRARRAGRLDPANDRDDHEHDQDQKQKAN